MSLPGLGQLKTWHPLALLALVVVVLVAALVPGALDRAGAFLANNLTGFLVAAAGLAQVLIIPHSSAKKTSKSTASTFEESLSRNLRGIHAKLDDHRKTIDALCADHTKNHPEASHAVVARLAVPGGLPAGNGGCC